MNGIFIMEQQTGNSITKKGVIRAANCCPDNINVNMNYREFVIKKLKNISLWRYILLLLLLVFLAINSCVFLRLNGVIPTFYELCLSQLNDISIILFPITITFFLLSCDFYSNGSDFDCKLLAKIASIKSITYYFLYAMILSAVFLVFFLGVNLLVSLVGGDSNIFSSRWNIGFAENMAPVEALGLSLIYVELRFVFLLMIIEFVNLLINIPWGFLVAFSFSFIDWSYYYLCNSSIYFQITLIEHTLVTYDQSLLSVGSRPLPLWSIMYWMILIFIVLILIYFVRKVRKKQCVNT